VDTGFLDFIAKQLSTARTPACRRAVLRILTVVKTNCEAGHYRNETEAEKRLPEIAKDRQGLQVALSAFVHFPDSHNWRFGPCFPR
jgi:hypothetical protein